MEGYWKSVSLLFTASAIIAAEGSPWTARPIDQWDQEDAVQVLTDSPWAKSTKPNWVRDLSPDERRESGNWEADIPMSSIGLAGLAGLFGPGPLEEAVALSHAKPDPGTVIVRWESSRPVQAAERIVADPGAPAVDSGQYYAIAIHNIPTPKRWNIEQELRGVARITRTGKRDLKPTRVAIVRNQGVLATVVYLFPRSWEITKRDGSLTFWAQIGRLVVTSTFSTSAMQIQGRLEL